MSIAFCVAAIACVMVLLIIRLKSFESGSKIETGDQSCSKVEIRMKGDGNGKDKVENKMADWSNVSLGTMTDDGGSVSFREDSEIGFVKDGAKSGRSYDIKEVVSDGGDWKVEDGRKLERSDAKKVSGLMFGLKSIHLRFQSPTSKTHTPNPTN